MTEHKKTECRRNKNKKPECISAELQHENSVEKSLLFQDISERQKALNVNWIEH
jgi:hypothetical protein